MSCGSPSRCSGRRAASLLAEVVDEHRGEVGLHEAGRDADDPGRAELGRQLAGQVDQRRLGEVVDAEPAPSVRRPPTEAMLMIVPGRVLERLLPRRLAPEQRRLEVDLERLVVASRLSTSSVRAEVRVGRRVVDEDVEPTEPFDRRATPPGRLHRASPALAAKISTSPSISAAAASSWSCLRLLIITLAPDGRERRRDRLADALRCAGDQCDLAVE